MDKDTQGKKNGKRRGRRTVKESIALALNIKESAVFSTLSAHAEMADVVNINDACTAVGRITDNAVKPCGPALRKLIASGCKSGRIGKDTTLGAINRRKRGRQPGTKTAVAAPTVETSTDSPEA